MKTRLPPAFPSQFLVLQPVLCYLVSVMSSDAPVSAFWPMLEDDEGALHFPGDSGCQPTSMTAEDAYNSSHSEWKMPGAAFDMEPETLDVCLPSGSNTQAWADEMWGDWVNAPQDHDSLQPNSRLVCDPTGTSGAMYDISSDSLLMDVVEPSALSLGGSAPPSNSIMPNDNSWALRPTQDDPAEASMASRQGNTMVPTDMMTAGKASAMGPYWPFTPFPYPSPGAFWPQEIIPGNEQLDQGPAGGDLFFYAGRSLPPYTSEGTAQPLSMPHMGNFLEDDVPFPTSTSTPFAQKKREQGSPSYNDERRHKRLKMNGKDSIPTQNDITTNGLSWQKGAKMPASSSWSAFHTFSLSGQPVQERTRKRLSEGQRAKVNEMRKVSACLNCRQAKLAVSVQI
jgi:hypothetical protein